MMAVRLRCHYGHLRNGLTRKSLANLGQENEVRKLLFRKRGYLNSCLNKIATIRLAGAAPGPTAMPKGAYGLCNEHDEFSGAVRRH